MYSISSVIQTKKKDYYEMLEQTTKLKNNPNYDFTAWTKWHLEITNYAIKHSIDLVNNIVFKTNFWDKFRNCNLSSTQQKVLNKVLDIGINNFRGGIDVAKYTSIAKISKELAKKEIYELVKIGCLVAKENGKSYVLNNGDGYTKNNYLSSENESNKIKIQ